MSNITVLGLGAMGSRMAINYVNAGHDVTVWNRTIDVAEELAASYDVVRADSPRTAAKDADVVVSMVTNDEAATRVWLDPEDGAFAAMTSTSIAIESSTLSPAKVCELGNEAHAAGIPFVEAPVLGSRPQADAGALFYLLGGSPDVLASAQPIIEVNAGNSTHVGKIGNAAIERSGLDTPSAIGTLAALPITSPALERILGLIRERNYEPNFPVHLVAKDLHYLAAAARHVGADVPVISATESLFEKGASGDQHDLDIAGIAVRYQHSC